MPRSPSDITAERLDCIIKRLELEGPYSDHLVNEADFRDTLAALRAYREVMDRLPQLERIDRAARAYADTDPRISHLAIGQWDALLRSLYDARATAPTEAQETRSCICPPRGRNITCPVHREYRDTSLPTVGGRGT